MVEQTLSSYLSGVCTGLYEQLTATGTASGVYPVTPFWRATELAYPAVIVKAGKFTEEDPNTHVYRGDVAVAILTSLDTAADPLAAHDAKVMEVYGAIASDSFLTSLNSGENFHAHGWWTESYDQDADERTLKSLLEYKLICQTRGL